MEHQCAYESRADLLQRIDKLEAQLRTYETLIYTNGDVLAMSGSSNSARAGPSGHDHLYNHTVWPPRVAQPQMGMRLSQDLDAGVMSVVTTDTPSFLPYSILLLQSEYRLQFLRPAWPLPRRRPTDRLAFWEHGF